MLDPSLRMWKKLEYPPPPPPGTQDVSKHKRILRSEYLGQWKLNVINYFTFHQNPRSQVNKTVGTLATMQLPA